MAKQRIVPPISLIPATIRDRRAVTALEYALIGAIVVVAIVIGFAGLSDTLSDQFASIGAAF